MAQIDRLNPPGLFTPPPDYERGLLTHVVISTGAKTIHIAGQTAVDVDMKLVGAGDHRAQAGQVFRNIKAALAGAGAEPKDVVSSVIYVVGLGKDGVIDQVIDGLDEALDDDEKFPVNAASMIGVETLVSPDMLIEVSVVAVID